MREFIKNSTKKVGESIQIKGWVNSRRDHGKIIFLDLRDVTGIIQAIASPDFPEAYETAKKLRPEFVIEAQGTIIKRPDKLINSNLETGSVEMQIQSLLTLNEAQTPPFELDKDTQGVNEDLRLKYRYLDMRSQRIKNNLVLRHQINLFFRNYLANLGFYEIETPCMTKSTPEGARDFIVPARKYPGKFYALPQSPQQYKQLLMVGGIERYFQIARCFRDEDQRGQRQPEFTQLDMEMSFVDQNEFMEIIEKMTIELVKTVTPEKQIQEIPFPRITFKEAIGKYNSDKPDLRKDTADNNLLAFEWIVDFPMFEFDEKDKKWTFSHNPFSGIVDKDIEDFKNNKFENVLAKQYDLVLNGQEAAGGSIRNHDSELLAKVFKILGHSKEEINNKFGHMIEAFKFGVPPHGGIAFGYDRLVAILAGEENIREVMAFPKNGEAYDPLMDSPSSIDVKQLQELGISIK